MTTLKKHVDSVHVIIVKKIEEKVNVVVRGSIEKQPTKKDPKFQEMQDLSFYLLKIIFKRMINIKNTFCKALVFNCEKSIAIVVFGKCLVQTSNFASMSSSCFPFLKTIFS